MIKVKRTPTPPASLAIEKAKKSGSYNQPDVVDLLEQDFCGKCYLCEQDELQAPEIEHLLPHHGGKDRDRMFDWNNLFYSCSHCNSVKNRSKYESNVADCCVTDPEEIIRQEFLDGKVVVSPLVDTIEAKTTSELVEDCFELRNTAIRTKECQTKIRALQRTMAVFHQSLEQYAKTGSSVKLRAIRGMIDRSYKFAGFTRTYIRTHSDIYPEIFSLL